MDNISKIIEEITRRSFKVIKKVYAFQREAEPQNKENLPEIGSRILFPKYSEHRKPSEKDRTKPSEKDRISEQELRFIFVEQLNKYADENNIDLYYSVETPTSKSYVFNEDNGGPKVVASEGEGVSARIDLAIMAKDAGNFKRIALIEFKAHNPDVNDYRKDICKLINEEWEDNPDCLKYFIQVINVKNEQRTWNNIENKKITAIDNLKEEDKKENEYSIEYRCFNLYSMNLKQGIIKTNKLQFTGCESPSTAE
jgi:hypothetical protein